MWTCVTSGGRRTLRLIYIDYIRFELRMGWPLLREHRESTEGALKEHEGTLREHRMDGGQGLGLCLKGHSIGEPTTDSAPLGPIRKAIKN